MSPSLELLDATKTYRRGPENIRALDAVSFNAHGGELVCLRGPSGSGKSTLLKAVAGLIRLDEGHVRVNGHELTRVEDLALLRRREVGVIFQDHVMVDDFTAVQNVALPLEAGGMPLAEARLAAQVALELVGVVELSESLPSQVSGGQLQRIGVARALAGGQGILLADEPTASLDSANAEALYSILRSLADEGRLVILATHDERALSHATRHVHIVDGRLDG